VRARAAGVAVLSGLIARLAAPCAAQAPLPAIAPPAPAFLAPADSPRHLSARLGAGGFGDPLGPAVEWGPALAGAAILTSSPWHGARLTGGAQGSWWREPEGGDVGEISARAGVTWERATLWLWGAGGTGVSRWLGDARPMRVGEAGGRIRIGGASLHLGLRYTATSGLPALFRDTVISGSGPDAQVGRVPVRAARPGVSYLDVESGAAWTRGRASADLTGGARLVAGRRPAGWARTGVGVRVGPVSVLTASLGFSAADPVVHSRAGPFGALSVQLVPRAVPAAAPMRPAAVRNAVRLTALTPGEYRLSLRLPGASRAEIAGDLSDWKPVELTSRGGWWELAQPLAPGTYHLNVRLDGGPWTAPPGLLTVPDEFGGSVGVLVVGR
jgi:hypothetical protein